MRRASTLAARMSSSARRSRGPGRESLLVRGCTAVIMGSCWEPCGTKSTLSPTAKLEKPARSMVGLYWQEYSAPSSPRTRAVRRWTSVMRPRSVPGDGGLLAMALRFQGFQLAVEGLDPALQDLLLLA